MSTFDYDEIADLAIELIAEFGQQTTLTRVGLMEGPVEDRTPGALLTFPVTVVDLNVQIQNEPGVTVRESKRVIYMGFSLIVIPRTDDQVLLGGVKETITKVKPLAPGGVTVLYEMELA